MKKIFYILLFVAAAAFMGTSCRKTFDQLYQNNNKPTKVPPSLLLNGALNAMYDAPYSMKERWCQYYCINYDYYGNNRYDFGSEDDYYNSLKNLIKMDEAAKAYSGNDLNPYEALGKFLRAYFFTKMSLQVGDIPLSSALLGADSLHPTYNSQKDVFKQAFAWLEDANKDLQQLITSPDINNLSDGQILKGDIYFNNNLAKWQKAVNTFRLRLLIHLSKKADDPDLRVKQQFADIIGNPAKYPIMADMSDNLQYVYVHPTNDYPMNPGNFGFDALRYNTSATYVGLLTQLNDPRVFITCEPATALVQGGTSPTSFTAFVGADPGEDLGEMYIKANAGKYSLINRKHFYDTYIGEPSIQIGYPEMLFNIAEAINRGWIGGNAENYYKSGIQASMGFYGIPDSGPMNVFFLHPGASLGTYDQFTVNVDFNTYYGNAAVKYTGNDADNLKRILIQKYLALFRHSGLESYYTYRRTGVPDFTVGDGTGNSERIPMRFQYPSSENSANSDNYQKALETQYGGNDDINGKMWIIK